GVGLPAMASLNRTTQQLYSVSLLPIEKNPDDRDIDTEEQAIASLETPRRGGPGAGPGGPPAKVDVKIEWDGIARRFRQLTRLSETVTSISPSPDSHTYAFVAFGGDDGGRIGGPAVYTIADDGT